MNAPLDDGAPAAETPKSKRIAFDQWLVAIEDYRDKGCVLGPEWLKIVKDKGYKDSWKEAETAFAEWKKNPDIWNGQNGPDKSSLKDANPLAPTEQDLIARGFVRDKDDPKLWVLTNVPAGKDGDSYYVQTLYDRMIKGLDFTANIMGHPFRAAFMEWAMQETTRKDGYLKRKLAEYAQMETRGEEVHYDLFRAEMLEQFGQDMLGKEKKFTSHLFAKNGVNSQYNNRYITQLSDGSWQTLTEADVAQLLQAKDGPHIVITANHAYGETLGDITPITDAYNKLIKCSTYDGFQKALPEQGQKYGDVFTDSELEEKKMKALKDKEIPYQDRARVAYERMVLDEKDGVQRGVNLTPYDKRPFTKGQTMLIAAVQTRENNFLNLAQLFHRLYDIDMVNKSGASATDTFEHGAPIARTMVYTLLKSIAQNPSQVTLNDKVFPPRFDAVHGPVVLRADAVDILRKALFFGFSKGGNDFRDGMRLLARTLSEQRDGKPVFQPSNGTIKDIISTVSVTAQSLNEKEMVDFYTNLGVDTSYFINMNDEIAQPNQGMSYRSKDKLMAFNGRTQDGGHHPATILENLGQNPYILQLHRGICAGLAGKPAIRFVEYTKFNHVPQAEEYQDAPASDARYPRYGLAITTEPGTSDELFEKAIGKIQSIFNKKESGLGHLRIGRIPGATGNSRYEIFSVDEKMVGNGNGTKRSDYGEGNLLTRQTMHLLADAFYKVNKELAGDIISSTSVAYPMLSTLGSDIVKAQQAFKDSNAKNEDGSYKDKLDEHGNVLWKEKLIGWTSGHRVHEHNMGQFGKLLQVGPEYTVGPDISAIGRVEEARGMALAASGDK